MDVFPIIQYGYYILDVFYTVIGVSGLKENPYTKNSEVTTL